jgi:hypothetical protein
VVGKGEEEEEEEDGRTGGRQDGRTGGREDGRRVEARTIANTSPCVRVIPAQGPLNFYVSLQFERAIPERNPNVQVADDARTQGRQAKLANLPSIAHWTDAVSAFKLLLWRLAGTWQGEAYGALGHAAVYALLWRAGLRLPRNSADTHRVGQAWAPLNIVA